MVKCFVVRNFGDTCPSVEMLNAYMIRERLGTPDLDPLAKASTGFAVLFGPHGITAHCPTLWTVDGVYYITNLYWVTNLCSTSTRRPGSTACASTTTARACRQDSWTTGQSTAFPSSIEKNVMKECKPLNLTRCVKRSHVNEYIWW